MASCDEATQLRRQRDVSPVHPHAFAEDPARQPAAAAAAAAAATAAGDRLLLEMSRTPSREGVMSSIFSHFDTDGAPYKHLSAPHSFPHTDLISPCTPQARAL